MFACFEAAKIYKVTGKGYRFIKKYGDYEEKYKCIIDDVTRACEYFQGCRKETPLGCETIVLFVDAIMIRMAYCNFVYDNFPHRTQNSELVFTKVEKYSIEIEDLFYKCYKTIWIPSHR